MGVSGEGIVCTGNLDHRHNSQELSMMLNHRLWGPTGHHERPREAPGNYGGPRETTAQQPSLDPADQSSAAFETTGNPRRPLPNNRV